MLPHPLTVAMTPVFRAAVLPLSAALALGSCHPGVPPGSAPAPTRPGSAAAAGHAPALATRPVARAPAPPPVAREFRGAWVTPLSGGHLPDWPSRPGLPASAQQAELRELLDAARDVGLNAVILHVRTAGDAMYPSPYAPWSAFLSGTSGVAPSPSYDPLAFAIAEAHARGLQLHAWFNPFRALLPNIANDRAAATHVTRTHPEWIRRYGTQTWIDPGDPNAREFVVATIADAVRRYDLDGIHIDDYFYPYREQESVRVGKGRRRRTVRRDIDFPDARTWERFGRLRGFTSRADWRRANVDAFVERLYTTVKAAKPWVLVGISPFGIWRSGHPAGVTGLDAYGEIYADSRKWLQRGWLDYLVPQLYWPLDGEQHRFTRLYAWWTAQNTMDRHLWPGVHTDRELIRSGQWGPREVEDEVTWLRSRVDADGSTGHVHFTLGALRPGARDVGVGLRERVYDTPALVPPSPWLGARGTLAAPTLSWRADTLVATPNTAYPLAWWLVQRQGAGGAWETRLIRAGEGPLVLRPHELAGARVVAVSALARDMVASRPASVYVNGNR
ncbi:MAG: glycoside hydrolase family 10 protein [Gemmatimonadaceae bacterium]